MPKRKHTFMAHYTFTINVPIEAASLEVAYRRSGRSTFDTALDQMQSINYHHWTVEDPTTGEYIHSADPAIVVNPTENTKECDV